MSWSVIECDGVTKRFGQVLAADDLSFALEPGEILSILGPSGCGKTTLLRLIAGFEHPDAGEIRILGKSVAGHSINLPPDRRNVGMVFQDYALFPHMTVAQNVTFGLQELPKAERRRRLVDIIDLVRLKGLEQRYPHELSGGQQQRVALARTLARRPIAVLLDEPFSNLDAGMRSEMRYEVELILRENGIATVFVTHDREEAFAMADRVGVMNNGHLDQIGRPDVIYHAPTTPFVARLAGRCDFLKGVFRDGIAVTEIGDFSCVSGNGVLSNGTAVDVLVYADDFQVVPDPEGRSLVRTREFRGDETLLTIGMPSGSVLRCRQRSYTALVPGTRVTLMPEKATPFVAFDHAEWEK